MAASRIPLEILHEFIRYSTSSPSALASWTLTSHDFFDFASPLLYRNVVLKRSEDVIPFLKRLFNGSRSSPSHP
ncbi:hypothetical protein BDY24DRAFT_417552 [Mrakia frigida]|uniref:uncharacterized protein n=1 Tax=Mrakia frigida TaxID=29902 RepID=UPI003FCC16AD